MDEAEDFIHTLRVVKGHDAKLQVNHVLWNTVFETSFDSLLFVCIGTVCNANFETSVRQYILHDDELYVKHKNNVLNLFLYVAQLGLHYRLFHPHTHPGSSESQSEPGAPRRPSDDTVEYAYYFLSHLKDELMFRIAEIISVFCIHKRIVRVGKVVKYFKRLQVYENLRGTVHRYVTRIIDAVDEQIELTDRMHRPRRGAERAERAEARLPIAERGSPPLKRSRTARSLLS